MYTYMSFLNFSDEVSSTLSNSEKLETILTTGVGGYLLVFVVLALIWIILALFGKLFVHRQETETNEEPIGNPVTEAPAPVVQTVTEAPAPVGDDPAVIAAIVAAISAYTEKPPVGFRVVSFRKKH